MVEPYLRIKLWKKQTGSVKLTSNFETEKSFEADLLGYYKLVIMHNLPHSSSQTKSVRETGKRKQLETH